jgi:CRP/FNR family transcriptional regulator, anaerobic regulatory protein
MIESDVMERLVHVLPVLRQSEPNFRREFQQKAFLARIPASHDAFLEGDRVDAIALLISGVVRVYKIGETGREITLYRFGNRQSCILTANAILSHKNFPAVATVEADAEAVMVPADAFSDWVRRSDAWREFVFDLLSERLATVMAVVGEVAFRRMDARLAAFLLEHSHGSTSIRITHQQIASELGTSREIISRLLEDFGAKGILASGRGKIEVLDAGSLQKRVVM